MELFWIVILVLHVCLFTLCICLAKCLKNYAHKKATALETGIISDQVSERLRANRYFCSDETKTFLDNTDFQITRPSLSPPSSTLTPLPVMMEQGENYEYK